MSLRSLYESRYHRFNDASDFQARRSIFETKLILFLRSMISRKLFIIQDKWSRDKSSEALESQLSDDTSLISLWFFSAKISTIISIVSWWEAAIISISWSADQLMQRYITWLCDRWRNRWRVPRARCTWRCSALTGSSKCYNSARNERNDTKRRPIFCSSRPVFGILMTYARVWWEIFTCKLI